MKFNVNILPDNPNAYTLYNASVVDGQLSLSNNGYARYSFTKDVLSRLTANFRLSMYTDVYLDDYAPDVFVYITAKTSSGFFNYTCTPTGSGIYSAIIPLEAADYEFFSITFTSKIPVVFSLWELCPEAAEDNITTIIEGVEQSLPKLLDDHNIYPFTIGQSEDTIALITCNLLGDTDLQGDLLLVYTAPNDCVLTIRFKDNGATELFSPLIYDIKAGRGNVAVPHAYLNRLAGIHNIAVTAQVSVGTITVSTHGMLFTIDGGYLAKRIIDFGSDIRDITVMQLPSDTSPSQIWAVGIDNNEAVVRRRDYNDTTTSSYEPMFSVGEAVEPAIEFNGNWVLRPGSNVYTLETETEPYVFFVDTLGDLYVQHGADTLSRTLLDTGVSKVSVCRGYKSHMAIANDQGLICAYIKDSTVFYRSYRYNVSTEDFFWDYAKSIPNLGFAEFVNVHRLNDYRVGIVSSTPNGNMWAISDRTYASQASKPEYLNFTLSDNNAFCSMTPSRDNSVLTFTANTISASHFTIEFNFDVRSVSGDLLNDIILSDGATNDDIASITLNGGLVEIILRREVNKNVTAKFKPFSLMRKGLLYGWSFVASVSVQFIVPTFKAENIGLELNCTPTCTIVPILRRNINATTETINFELDATPLCDLIFIDRRSAATPSETFNMTLMSEASCTLTHISVLPV